MSSRPPRWTRGTGIIGLGAVLARRDTCRHCGRDRCDSGDHRGGWEQVVGRSDLPVRHRTRLVVDGRPSAARGLLQHDTQSLSNPGGVPVGVFFRPAQFQAENISSEIEVFNMDSARDLPGVVASLTLPRANRSAAPARYSELPSGGTTGKRASPCLRPSARPNCSAALSYTRAITVLPGQQQTTRSP